jgi:hypothetical protein
VPEFSNYTCDAAVAADLAVMAQGFDQIDPDGPPVFTVGPDGRGHVVDVDDYRAAPRRTRAARTFTDATSLLAYLRRHDPRPETEDSAGATASGYPSRFTGDPDPDARPLTIWANERTRQIVAVLDDAHNGQAGWAGHTATLQLEHDEDWVKWTRRNAQLMDQESAAEFVEDLLHTVVEPDAAELLEIVSSLQVHRQMVVGQTVRLQLRRHPDHLLRPGQRSRRPHRDRHADRAQPDHRPGPRVRRCGPGRVLRPVPLPAGGPCAEGRLHHRPAPARRAGGVREGRRTDHRRR